MKWKLCVNFKWNQAHQDLNGQARPYWIRDQDNQCYFEILHSNISTDSIKHDIEIDVETKSRVFDVETTITLWQFPRLDFVNPPPYHLIF
jgi:hypothetical protein